MIWLNILIKGAMTFHTSIQIVTPLKSSPKFYHGIKLHYFHSVLTIPQEYIIFQFLGNFQLILKSIEYVTTLGVCFWISWTVCDDSWCVHMLLKILQNHLKNRIQRIVFYRTSKNAYQFFYWWHHAYLIRKYSLLYRQRKICELNTTDFNWEGLNHTW